MALIAQPARELMTGMPLRRQQTPRAAIFILSKGNIHTKRTRMDCLKEDLEYLRKMCTR